MKPILYIIIPCYNEEKVLPVTEPLFLKKLTGLIEKESIAPESRVVFVNDGSRDRTWELIKGYAEENSHILGLSLSRNRGHQNALLAGLMEMKDRCDITISIDCDGQDDINAMDEMLKEYEKGAEIVYGVRNNRDTDSFFKRSTAQGFYRLMKAMGVESIYNHADYRLVSARALDAFADFEEVNLFLRGLFPLVGFHSACVYYAREKRMAGESHYPIKKMVAFALDGITSLSVKPIDLIAKVGLTIVFFSFVGIIYALVSALLGHVVSGWTSMTCIICFLGGIQLLSLSIIGQYVGKIYLESKHRPRYIISERTEDQKKGEDRK
ncbi:MAG: glycosyltransferase family 2 protein [Lachnospiraceae bacterium]|nr:glycosyltransferase family 2 protein [Lachnospiraceae bacterium]